MDLVTWTKSRFGPIYRSQYGTVRRIRNTSGSAALYKAEVPGRVLGEYATLSRAKDAVLAAVGNAPAHLPGEKTKEY